jgi:predicted ester cyclase
MEPFVALMRRYCVDYTNAQDLSVCDELMVPSYTLHMGGYHLTGRDEAYKSAVAAQFEQFPGLCLTVHELAASGDRLAMRFSEHGASARHGGNAAAWSGLGLYRWNGERLVENFVEQDYYARRRQLISGVPDAVEAPAVAPWDTVAEQSQDEALATVRAWLCHTASSDALAAPAGLRCDDGNPAHRLLEVESVEVDDAFSTGNRVGFHAALTGRYCGGLGEDVADRRGAEVTLHIAGLVCTEAGGVISGRVIRDRLGVYKTLRSRR